MCSQEMHVIITYVLNLFYETELEIVVGHQIFSDQNLCLSEHFWFWSDKMPSTLELEIKNLCTHYHLITISNQNLRHRTVWTIT